MVFQTISSVLTKGVLRGGGDTKFLMMADVLFLWIASVPLGFLAGITFELSAFWVYIAMKIDMVIKAGLEKNVIINSFSGDILKYVDEKYDGFFPLHGYFPPTYLKEGADESYYDGFKNLQAICLFNKTGNLDENGGGYPVVAKQYFDMIIEKGLKPWVYYGEDLFEYVEKAVNNGAVAVTSNNPVKCAEFLRKLGVRN